MALNPVGGPNDTDRSPVVTVEIGPIQKASAFNKLVTFSNTIEFKNVIEYSYDSDILQLGDPFSVSISNIDGDFSSKVQVGYAVRFYVADPDVQGGTKVLKLFGIITGVDYSDDPVTGSKILINGGDLGWHLVNNTGPIFQRYRNQSLNTILQESIDGSWQIQGVRQGNDFNRKAKQGRAGLINPGTGGFAIPPVIQFEPGQSISDVIIPLARRQKYLINVSADGWLQFFQPSYVQPASYTFHHHRATEITRSKNNVERARLRTSLDGIYTKVTCVGQVPYLQLGQPSPGNPNEGRIRKDYVPSPAPLPFAHNQSFSDADQMDSTAVSNRAQWKWQRGQFDSWIYEITVKGHSQNGLFYETDTMCGVEDTVFGIDPGNYYISACRYSRTESEGTTTTLQIHRPNVLGA